MSTLEERLAELEELVGLQAAQIEVLRRVAYAEQMRGGNPFNVYRLDSGWPGRES